jgi:hypothetical protein
MSSRWFLRSAPVIGVRRSGDSRGRDGRRQHDWPLTPDPATRLNSLQLVCTISIVDVVGRVISIQTIWSERSRVAVGVRIRFVDAPTAADTSFRRLAGSLRILKWILHLRRQSGPAATSAGSLNQSQRGVSVNISPLKRETPTERLIVRDHTMFDRCNIRAVYIAPTGDGHRVLPTQRASATYSTVLILRRDLIPTTSDQNVRQQSVVRDLRTVADRHWIASNQLGLGNVVFPPRLKSRLSSRVGL